MISVQKTKVKIFEGVDYDRLTEEINQFINETLPPIEVKSVQYQATSNLDEVVHSAMVLYTVVEKEEDTFSSNEKGVAYLEEVL